MRTEQKLLLAAGVVACGLASSLLFRREVSSVPPARKSQSGNSQDLNLTLRRDLPRGFANSPTDRDQRPTFPANASISAIPDEGRAIPVKRDIPAPPADLPQERRVEDGEIKEQPVLPNGRIRDLIPSSNK